MHTELSVDHYQETGFAEIFLRNDETEFALPTVDEMEALERNATERDGRSFRAKGVIRCVNWADADLRYNAAAFMPTDDGLWYWLEPVYGLENGERRIVDLVYYGGGHDGAGHLVDWDTWMLWGWTTGRAAVLGADNLDKSYTETAPLMVYTDIDAWSEDGRTGIVILKYGARRLLTRAAFVRLDNFEDVQQLARDFFSDPRRVQYPQDDLQSRAEHIAEMVEREIRCSTRPAWLPETSADMDAYLAARRGTMSDAEYVTDRARQAKKAAELVK
jgi:hypothetical protein